jgi:DNA phosphorothioation system restriction enzyme
VFVSLKDLNLLQRYRTGRHNLLRDFYVPCLGKSLAYDRAVGFFSSSSLASAAQGLTAFIQAGGEMRLVASPHLSAADIEAIETGLRQRDRVIADALTRALDQDFAAIARDRLACLAWLLAQGRLGIKIAVVKDLQNAGIYHEKLGIFLDADGNRVVFGGSANESDRAYRRNFECIDVFRSWRLGDDERIDEKVADFDDLWGNQTPELEVMAFPEAAKRKLLERCPDYPPGVSQELDAAQQAGTIAGDYRTVLGVPMLPNSITLRNYQQKALENWFANQGRGTLKMATGSGKTITALAIAAALYQKCKAQNKPLQALLIICPYRHLVTQWATESRKFGLQPILAFDKVQTWQGELQSQLMDLSLGSQPFVTVITTNATLMRGTLQSQLPFFPQWTLVIGDEAHNLGAQRLEQSLPDNQPPLRLALSATPERYFDELGTDKLWAYFGPVLQPEFTLKDAIAAGALTPYTYHPLLIELTEAEIEAYAELTAKIGRMLFLKDRAPADQERLTALLVKRARLVGAAANKLNALRSLMATRQRTRHTLFYCGDGSVEDDVSQESLRQLEAVTRLLQDEIGYRVQPYTAETRMDERDEWRYQFESGILQGLVAIRCLDEGVDIPAIQTAVILASSSNPRQFVQRRGRILRRSPGKERAELFDMIVVPPDLDGNLYEVERKLLKSELKRFAEFADLALNRAQAREALQPLQRQYDLLEL